MKQGSVKLSAYDFYMTTIVYTIQYLLYIHMIGLIFAVKTILTYTMKHVSEYRHVAI